MSKFIYSPSKHVPFRDMEVLERVRNIKRADITKHWNPDFKITVLKDNEVDFRYITDIFYRIKTAADADEKLVLILGNPDPAYMFVAHLINMFKVNCRKLHIFNMDEYADEDGNTAPEDWPLGFMYAMKHNFFLRVNPELRPPEKQINGPTTQNINYYGKQLEDLGNADVCYSGAGWTGHLAFVEPDAPEVPKDLEEFKQMGPRIVTLSPFTLAQNSLHGSFGKSGDIAAVPPRAATIGPAEALKARLRIDVNAITVHGTTTSWQRMTTRLVAHGPVTPLVPESVLQTVRTDFWISETLAADIEPDWEKGY